MKILITGVNSYVGNSFIKYVKQYAPDMRVDTISLRTDAWKEQDFSGYDSIFHVAGKAHADVAGASAKEQEEYYRVNRDLAYECALVAKAAGVPQFIYMSSIIVYGDGARLGKRRVITKDTPLRPAGFYGDSKKQAEEKLLGLDCDSFRVCILRPPMIYGPGSKGNYPQLAKMARKLPVFPQISNQRSMLYVENLCHFVLLCVQNKERGIFFPQNNSYVETSNMVREIAKVHGKRIHLSRAFYPLLVILSGLSELPGVAGSNFFLCRLLKKAAGLSNKAFGNLVYEKSLSTYREPYCSVGFAESIRRTEKPEYQNGKAACSDGAAGEMRISVITVCYNAQEQLPKTISSVLEQTKAPYEYIFVDGASTDRSLEVIEGHRAALEERGIRVEVISEPDRGIYNAMNKGVAHATGDYVGILNAGDYYERDCLEKSATVLRQTGCDVTFGNIRILRQDGSSLIKKAKKRCFQTSRSWNHPTMLVRRSLAVENPFLEKGIHDDYGFYLALVAKGCSIETIPYTLATFQMGGASNRKSLKEAVNRIRDRYLYCYKVNGFSPLYIVECVFIEGIKALL